jgi:hypothetical protein
MKALSVYHLIPELSTQLIAAFKKKISLKQQCVPTLKSSQRVSLYEAQSVSKKRTTDILEYHSFSSRAPFLPHYSLI